MRISRRHIECRRDIHRMNIPFLDIYESLKPSEEEKAKQKQLMALLEKHVNKEWPEARLYLYGSCANSFGFKKSDIDVCLAIDDLNVNKSEVLLKLADILQADNLQNVQVKYFTITLCICGVYIPIENTIGLLWFSCSIQFSYLVFYCSEGILDLNDFPYLCQILL